ncbi:MAG: glycosyltransferase family 4 protein [Planctomycetes bacterium]|nr:glycosyltransferase family 4 protein [Planctomycetota bacterium]
MKVLLDCRSARPGMGGIGGATLALARHLPAALAPTDELVLLRDARAQAGPLVTGPRVSDLPVQSPMLDPAFEQLALPGLLEDHRVDVFHGTCFMTPVAASRVARVATVHDVVFSRHPELVEPWLRDLLDRGSRLSCALADALVTVSEFSRREIAAVYGRPEDAIDVVPNAADERFHRVVRQPPQGRPFLLYVGAIEAKKGIAALLAGFAELLRRRPDLPHVLALAGGQGGQAFDLGPALERLGPARERVRVLGHVPDEALQDLYARAEAFAYLSRYEGFGLPPLEAMAAGVPTVVSDRSSLPEVVGDGALVVDPDDPGALAGAFLSLIEDATAREALVARGRARARTFSWADAARRMVEVYRQALARRDARLADRARGSDARGTEARGAEARGAEARGPGARPRLRVLAGRGA